MIFILHISHFRIYQIKAQRIELVGFQISPGSNIISLYSSAQLKLVILSSESPTGGLRPPKQQKAKVWQFSLNSFWQIKYAVEYNFRIEWRLFSLNTNGNG